MEKYFSLTQHEVVTYNGAKIIATEQMTHYGFNVNGYPAEQATRLKTVPTAGRSSECIGIMKSVFIVSIFSQSVIKVSNRSIL